MDMRQAFNLTLDVMKIKASEIARSSGVAESDISKFRNGHTDCGYQKVQRMIEVLSPAAQDYFWFALRSGDKIAGVKPLVACEKSEAYKVSKKQKAIAV
jgi:predicted transcriptional regulator